MLAYLLLLPAFNHQIESLRRQGDTNNTRSGREESEDTVQDRYRDRGNMPYLNTQISAMQRQVQSEPQTLGATEFRSAMHEMASSIVESIRESNRSINDNLQNLVSNMPPSSSQTGTNQNSQTRGRDRNRISRTPRHRRSEVRHTVNVSDSSELDGDIGLSSTTNGSNGRNTQSHVRYDSVKFHR